MTRFRTIRWGILWASGMLAHAIADDSARASQESKTVELAELLGRDWVFADNRTPGTRYYAMDNINTEIANDGSRAAPTIYRLWVEVQATSGEDGNIDLDCLCRRASIDKEGGSSRIIPAFTDYAYQVHLGVDAEEQIFGIPHEAFQGLVDDQGQPLELLEDFVLYGSFLDLHMFDTFTAKGEGDFDCDLSSLRRVGQQHTANVGIELPIHLEPTIQPGSRFKNGTTTLTFQGMTLAQETPCALLQVESKDGAFELILAPQPGVTMTAIGGSHYTGTLALELDSQWLHRLEFREFVVSQITMAGQEIGHSVSERLVIVKSVDPDEFELALK